MFQGAVTFRLWERIRKTWRLVSAGSVCGWWHTTDTRLQITLPDVVSLIPKGAHYVNM